MQRSSHKKANRNYRKTLFRASVVIPAVVVPVVFCILFYILLVWYFKRTDQTTRTYPDTGFVYTPRTAVPAANDTPPRRPEAFESKRKSSWDLKIGLHACHVALAIEY